MCGDPIAIRQLGLTNFRSYVSTSLKVDARPVVLTGANGAGKTNLLEAISLLVPGRGLRRAALDALTRTGLDTWAVAAHVDGLLGDARLGTGLQAVAPGETKRAGRTVRVDGETLPANSLAHHMAMLWLTPAMDGLFTGPAGDRRRFMDRLVLALDPDHSARVSRFERLTRQRNKLLEDARPDTRWCGSIEADMAAVAVALAVARREAIVRLAAQGNAAPDDMFPAFVIRIEGEVEASLETATATQAEDIYRDSLAANRSRDAAAGRTLGGPHRSDLAVTHQGKNVPAAMASTGEQKALLIGLILAQADIVARAHAGRPPILLLDEVAAHLDDMRRSSLFERLIALRSQVWMTGTDRAPFSPLADTAQTFEVSQAELSPW